MENLHNNFSNKEINELIDLIEQIKTNYLYWWWCDQFWSRGK